MTPTRAIITLTTTSALLLAGVATLNYTVDPMCYFHCNTIEPNRRTANAYYRAAQRIAAHPDTETIILGSSRGEAVSPTWLASKTGGKALNLSLGGAEITAKLALLGIALEKTRLKRVLWIADYFELIPENADSRIKNTPALTNYLPGGAGRGDRLQALIDHNTLEATLRVLASATQTAEDLGPGSGIDYTACAATSYPGERSAHQLEKETGLGYDTYARKVLRPPQSNASWRLLEDTVARLAERGVELTLVIPPYRTPFARRLEREQPALYTEHRRWASRLTALRRPNVAVLDYFEGIPGDDDSPRFWTDGVHFTCKGVLSMVLPSPTSSEGAGGGQPQAYQPADARPRARRHVHPTSTEPAS